MRLNLIDGRTLAVAVIQPASGLVYNWSTGQYEQLAAQPSGQHLRAFAALAGASGAWTTLITADLGTSLEAAGAYPVVAQLDANGNATGFLDPGTLAMPGPNPQVWNWPR